ncbi:TRAF3-interacting protein 1 [Araneus ventricosus]|uniref:TRAF3-interacting protein 1 n=1 Tax=Araneus ventricosus TaxID=182803 RepID=A0A4Y2FI44_ARAVE|nr:TRAF3-interacting protein 1 [Araneus ventricosus]
MAEEIDSDVIKKTQEILGSVIKRPALTDKSLKKPPFRFLHDIITNIIKSSGFLKGLYTPAELQSENVKDKESKILFLQKAADVLALVTNQPVSLKPSKVVAGHDPAKTNLFLQILGTAVKNKLDSKEAVEKVLGGKAQTSPTKPLKERRASVDRRSKGSNEKSHSRSLTKTLEPVKDKDGSKSKDGEKTKEKSKKDREKSRERTKHKTDESKKSSKEKTSKSKEPVVESKPEEDANDTNDLENHAPAPVNDAEPSTSMTNGDVHDKEEMLENEAGDSSVNEKPVREKSNRPHSSRSARPPSARSKRTKPGEENGPVKVGSLVKKLLETKKDLEGGSQHTPTKKVEIDRSQMSQASHERHSASKELAQLRNFVQSLSKTAVPLGRMLDFLQEDLDSMKMELRMWKEEHEQNLMALHKEQSATESLLEPLRAQLDDLDQVVQNQLDANSALKASIARNDERIQRMLASVNHKS